MAKTAQRDQVWEFLNNTVPNHTSEKGDVDWSKVVALAIDGGLKTGTGLEITKKRLQDVWSKARKMQDKESEEVVVRRDQGRLAKQTNPEDNEMMTLLKQMFDDGTLSRIAELYHEHGETDDKPDFGRRESKGMNLSIPLKTMALNKLQDDHTIPNWVKKDTLHDLVNYLLWKYLGCPVKLEDQADARNETEGA